MDSEATRAIKKRLPYYNLEMPSPMRTPCYGFEVETATGYVDVIRFEHYIASRRLGWRCGCVVCSKLPEGEEPSFPPVVSKARCHGCVFKRNDLKVSEIGVKVTCYEIKVSVSDFKSKYGHNFYGNENYYVVTKDIADKVKPLIPESVGLLVYYPSGTIRKAKDSAWNDVDAETMNLLMFNTLRKHCNGKMVEAWDKILGIE